MHNNCQEHYTVYMHIAPNTKKYIGITKHNIDDVNKRWKNGDGYKTQRLIGRAIKKYGWDNFKHIIIAYNLSKDDACRLEQIYINWYNTNNAIYGYNVSTGGECGNKGSVYSDEYRKHLSEIRRGQTLSEITKQKISRALKGRKHSIEHSKKVGDANRGRKATEDTIKKLRESHIGKTLSIEQRNKRSESMKKYLNTLSEEELQQRIEKFTASSKQVVSLYINDKFINNFESCKACAEFLHISPGMLCMMLSGKRTKQNVRVEKCKNLYKK